MIDDKPKRKFLAGECNAILHILEENGIQGDINSMTESEENQQLCFAIRGKSSNISNAIRSIFAREHVESVWSGRDYRSGSSLTVSFEKKW